jgi:hypothetical protein
MMHGQQNIKFINAFMDITNFKHHGTKKQQEFKN